MSLTEGIHMLTPSTPQLDKILSGIIHLHADCIINDHTMARFLPPLSYERIRQRWENLLQSATTNERFILVHISRIQDRAANSQHRKPPFPPGEDKGLGPLDGDLEVSGLVALYMPWEETNSFRGEVHSLVVSGLHRGRGIGRMLMDELEVQALERGRWGLMLDTTVGAPPEKVYVQLGWTRMGVVPNYGYVTTGEGDDVKLVDQVWFWKDLRSRSS